MCGCFRPSRVATFDQRSHDFHYLRHWESEERHWLRLYQPLTKRELLEMEDSTDSLADPQKLWTYTSFATPLDLLEYWEKEVCESPNWN